MPILNIMFHVISVRVIRHLTEVKELKNAIRNKESTLYISNVVDQFSFL